MSLNDIKISELLLEKTDGLIKDSNYPVLRQYLLDKKPIDNVIVQIRSFISTQCVSDQQDYQRQFTQSACDAQIEEDKNEARADERERQQDQLHKSNIEGELPELKRQLSILSSTAQTQTSKYNQIQRQLDELNAQRARLDLECTQAKQQRSLLEITPIYHHAHPGYDETRIHLGHPHAHIDVAGSHHIHHPSVLHAPSFVTDAAWLMANERVMRLSRELTELESKISSKQTERNREKRALDEIRANEKRNLERRKEIEHQLNYGLPTKEQQRSNRVLERLDREQARGTDNDSKLRQLSTKNLTRLKSKIAQQNQQLESKRDELIAEAIRLGYSVFLSRVELNLQQRAIPMSQLEYDALKSLVSILKNHETMEEEVKAMQTNLTNTRANLKDLKGRQHRNEQLSQQNTELQTTSESADNYRSTALYSALFTGVGSLASVGVVIAYSVNPLFFMVPAALGILTTISLNVALSYHIKKSHADEQIIRNKSSIQSNENITEKEPQLSPADNLLRQIEKARGVVERLEKEISEKQQALEQLLGKASNITANIAYAQQPGLSIFSSANDPSAPPSYQEAIADGLLQHEDSFALK